MSMFGRGIVLGGLLTLCGSVAVTAEIKTVEATGEGITAEMARKDALRNALEKGAKVLLASYSQSQDFELVRDTIFSRAEGLVTDFDILEEGPGAGGIFFCKIRAKVSDDAVASTWGQVQNVLAQRGNPNVMVYIAETIDHQPSTSSILESKIEERLIKSGFNVFDRSQLDAIRAKEADDAARTGDNEKMRAIANSFSAQIFIMGNSNANKADNSSAYGVSLVNYNCDVQAKVFYADTGKLLASSSLPVTRGGARGHTQFSPQAGKMAIHNAAAPLIEEMYQTVMKSWAAEISFGGQIAVEVTGIPTSGKVLKLKKLFKGIANVEAVNVNRPSPGVAVFRIRAKMTAEDLATYLTEGDWEARLEVLDWSLSTIKTKWIGK